MMKRWAALGAGLGLAAAALVHAPAAWLATVLSASPDSGVRLVEPSGTVWQGSARLVLGERGRSQEEFVLPGRLQWSLGWTWSHIQLFVQAECCMQTPQQLHLVPSWGGFAVTLADGASQWPAQMMAALGAPWNTVQLAGALHLRTQGLSVGSLDGRTIMRGRIDLDALGMSSRLSTLRPIGSYRLTLVGVAAAAPTLEVHTLEGPLRVTGSGQWLGSRWKFSGEASADAQSESALANLLNMVGRRQGAKSMISLG